MANWNFNPSEYTARNFEPIPEGDYRVTISGVTEELFNSGNEGFKITLDVPNHKSKLWYYLSLDPRDPKRTNQRLGSKCRPWRSDCAFQLYYVSMAPRMANHLRAAYSQAVYIYLL